MSEAAGWAAKWLRLAEGHLHVAKAVVEDMRPPLPYMACFHCREAAVKSLSAFLAASRKNPPATSHPLRLCWSCAGYEPAFDGICHACAALAPYTEELLYPGGADVTEAEAVRAIQAAEKVYVFCAGLVPELMPAGQEQDAGLSQTPEQSL
jgi:HEPN domain-containing protein